MTTRNKRKVTGKRYPGAKPEKITGKNDKKALKALALAGSAFAFHKGRKIYRASKSAKEIARQKKLLEEAKKRLAKRTHRKGGAVATYNRNLTASATSRKVTGPRYGGEERRTYVFKKRKR